MAAQLITRGLFFCFTLSYFIAESQSDEPPLLSMSHIVKYIFTYALKLLYGISRFQA
jgi:hypothetical protein